MWISRCFEHYNRIEDLDGKAWPVGVWAPDWEDPAAVGAWVDFLRSLPAVPEDCDQEAAREALRHVAADQAAKREARERRERWDRELLDAACSPTVH